MIWIAILVPHSPRHQRLSPTPLRRCTQYVRTQPNRSQSLLPPVYPREGYSGYAKYTRDRSSYIHPTKVGIEFNPPTCQPNITRHTRHVVYSPTRHPPCRPARRPCLRRGMYYWHYQRVQQSIYLRHPRRVSKHGMYPRTSTLAILIFIKSLLVLS